MRLHILSFITAFAAIFCVVSCIGQVVNNNYLLERQILISDFNGLDTKTISLGGNAAQALAKIEIADGLWALDPEKSKRLLRQSLLLVVPPKDEKQARGKEISKGLFAPSEAELIGKRLRNRIFRLAARDRKFLDELSDLLVEMGVAEKAQTSLDLANEAIKEGDLDTAKDLLNSASNSGSFDMGIGQVIYALARTDRAAADAIILQTIARIRVARLSPQAFNSVITGLDMAVYGEVPVFLGQPVIPPADISVIKAYLSFQIDKIWEIGGRSTGGVREMRGRVGALWPRISRFAPELTQRFQMLEVQSRLDPNDNNLPERGTPESQQEHDESIYKKAENSRKPEDIENAITTALWRNDFKKAKEFANLHQDDKRQRISFNRIYSAEARYLIEKDELDDAEKIANKIDEPRLVLTVFSKLIRAIAEKKQSARARDLTSDVFKKISLFDENISVGYPLSQFTRTAASIDSMLAFDFLGMTIKWLNKKKLPPNIGEVDFEPSLFIDFARIDDSRAQQAAEMLTDNLRQIVALARIYKFRAEINVEKAKVLRTKAKEVLH